MCLAFNKHFKIEIPSWKKFEHICVSQKCSCSLLDVRVKRGDVAGPDHHLVTAKIQLKLTRVASKDGRVTFHVQQL